MQRERSNFHKLRVFLPRHSAGYTNAGPAITHQAGYVLTMTALSSRKSAMLPVPGHKNRIIEPTTAIPDAKALVLKLPGCLCLSIPDDFVKIKVN
jgi:hypothetical protein